MSAHEQLAALAALAAILIAIAGGITSQALRRNPEKRERRRRLQVNRTGRLGDALITEVTETLVCYTYWVNGVQYNASQDIAALQEKLPSRLGSVMGLANIKYSAKNPANSIVVCEEWSGLRNGSARSAAGGR